jgi:hypothetical protein
MWIIPNYILPHVTPVQWQGQTTDLHHMSAIFLVDTKYSTNCTAEIETHKCRDGKSGITTYHYTSITAGNLVDHYHRYKKQRGSILGTYTTFNTAVHVSSGLTLKTPHCCHIVTINRDCFRIQH